MSEGGNMHRAFQMVRLIVQIVYNGDKNKEMPSR